jgi:hypothetical protein
MSIFDFYAGLGSMLFCEKEELTAGQIVARIKNV